MGVVMGCKKLAQSYLQPAQAFCGARVEDYSSRGLKSSLPTPQMGQTQSEGIFSKGVPGAMLLSGSPLMGS